MTIPSTYAQAQREAAILYQQFLGFLPKPKKQDVCEEYKFARHKYERYCRACYSLPWIRPFMNDGWSMLNLDVKIHSQTRVATTLRIVKLIVRMRNLLK